MSAKPVWRISAWWEAGRSLCSLPEKKGLSASHEGWLGKEPLLPASSSPAALPASHDWVPKPWVPTRHQHCHEQAAASTRKGYRVFHLFAKS